MSRGLKDLASFAASLSLAAVPFVVAEPTSSAKARIDVGSTTDTSKWKRRAFSSTAMSGWIAAAVR